MPTALTSEAIAGELRAAFPGVPMRVSPDYVQNAYGPFGYATGRGAGRDLCLYGWQRIGGKVMTPFIRQGAIDVRLRLCEAGASERDLLADMYRYTVRAPFGPGWSAGEPIPSVNPPIGTPGAMIFPTPVPVVVETMAPLPVRRTTVAAEAKAPAATAPAPAPSLPIPPLAAGVQAAVLPVSVPLVPGPGVAAVAGVTLPASPGLAANVPVVPPPPMPVVLPDLTAEVSQ